MTKEICKQAETYFKHSLNNLLTYKPVDFEEARSSITSLYLEAGFAPPKQFFLAEGPFSAGVACCLLALNGDESNCLQHKFSPQVNSKYDMDYREVYSSDNVIKIDHKERGILESVRSFEKNHALVNTIVDNTAYQLKQNHIDVDKIKNTAKEYIHNIGCGWWGSIIGKENLYITKALYDHKDSDNKLIDALVDMELNCDWWQGYDDFVIFQNRPEYIKLDEHENFHSENSPAIKYGDNCCIYYWHGINVPKDWIENKANLTAVQAFQQENTELRRAACEIIGWNKVLKSLNAIILDDSKNPLVGRLLEVQIPDIGKEKFLQVRCGTDREFALPVPPEMQSATQAQAWLNFTTEDMYIPNIRT